MIMVAVIPTSSSSLVIVGVFNTTSFSYRITPYSGRIQSPKFFKKLFNRYIYI